MKTILVIFGILTHTSRVFGRNDSIPYDNSSDNERELSLVYSRLHKCFCFSDQILVGEVCQNVNTTISGLIEEYSSKTEKIETRFINDIVVESLVCPSNYLTLTLPGESFALRTSGNLFNVKNGLNLDFSMYCIEHTAADEQEQVSMEVHLCLPIPLVPACCPDQLYDPIANRCMVVNNTDVEINVMLGKRLLQLEIESFSNVLNCEDEIVRVPLTPDSYSSQMKLTNEGLILNHRTSLFGNTVNIPSPEYCVETEIDNVVTSALYCYVDPVEVHLEICKGVTCIRKCCPLGEVYDMNNFKCIPSSLNNKWNPEFFAEDNFEQEDTVDDYKIITGFPICGDFFPISPNNYPPDFFLLLTNGSLYVENLHLSLPSTKYCIDNFVNEGLVVQEAMVCFPEKSEEMTMCSHVGLKLYPSLLLVSCVFLLITLIVYAIIPDLHSKIQGKCLIASIISLLASYISLAIVQLGSSTLYEGSCIALGFIIQFSVLSAFFWLNVMSYDIWRTLRSMKTGKDTPAGARRRFLLYSLYAWGCPFLIVIVTITMQFLPKSVDKSNLILPRIGETDCIFPKYDKKVFWVYLNGFISIILAMNTFFFVHLAYNLVKARKFSESALGKKTQLHKEWAKLYLKLFLIMGITWIFEISAFIDGSCEFWVVTDIVNSLRGFFIFVIFVCKRDVIKKLMSESTPAFRRMTTTVRNSSTFFSRSSKRTSTMYVDPITTDGTHEPSDPSHQNHADVNL